MIPALLGATGLLLVVAVVLTVMKMNNANDNAELKELRDSMLREADELRKAREEAVGASQQTAHR